MQNWSKKQKTLYWIIMAVLGLALAVMFFILELAVVSIIGILWAGGSIYMVVKGIDKDDQEEKERKEFLELQEAFMRRISQSDRNIYEELKANRRRVSLTKDILFILRGWEKDLLVITKTMICPNPTWGKPIPIGKGLQKSHYYLQPQQMLETTSVHKNASVAGRAVAGGVLAGGVGAVVGAVSAVGKNASGGVTTHYTSGSTSYEICVPNMETAEGRPYGVYKLISNNPKYNISFGNSRTENAHSEREIRDIISSIETEIQKYI